MELDGIIVGDESASDPPIDKAGSLAWILSLYFHSRNDLLIFSFNIVLFPEVWSGVFVKTSYSLINSKHRGLHLRAQADSR